VVAGEGALLAPTVTRRLIAEFVRRPPALTAAPSIEEITERNAKYSC
jgi:hypothetical protein